MRVGHARTVRMGVQQKEILLLKEIFLPRHLAQILEIVS